MANHRTRWVAVIGAACLLVVTGLATPARGDELWVAPTAQQDVGGLGIGSNGIWPVTPIGAVRLTCGPSPTTCRPSGAPRSSSFRTVREGPPP